MSVSAVSSGTTAATTPTYLSSPGVQLAQLQDSSLSTLFSGVSGEPSDLVALTSAVVALPMYQQPGLLTGLTQWDGSLTPGSERAATPATTPPAVAPPAFSFNPFDPSSWGTNSTGSNVNVSA